jgi:signal transduction histidine kinase
MSNDYQLPCVYPTPQMVQEVNQACLQEDDSLGQGFLNITIREQQVSDIDDNQPQTTMVLSGQQYANPREELISLHISQQLRILQRLTSLTNQGLTNLPQLLEQVVKEVYDAIDIAQFCLIALHNPQTKELELTAKVGIDTEKLLYLQLNDSLECVYPFPIFSSVSPCSMYAIAIESAEVGRLGVLAIGNWDNPYAFDLSSQNLLNALGGVVAIAINSAKMSIALKEREERLTRQTEMLLQQNLELEKTRHQIQLQKLQLLEATKLKSQFLATTSHELRTPLNVILGLSQVLLRQRIATLSEKQLDMVQRILNNGNHLLEIIDDMLDFATVEAGCFSLQIEKFNLTNLVLTTVTEYRSLAEEKLLNLQIENNLADSLVVNDSTRIKQVLVKLLLNAIKFTETGNITVRLGETSNDRIAIAVQDSGIGIAESDLEKIFEEFCQVDQTSTRKYGGAGLGLAITKSLVEILQGTITVVSKLGEGSTFCIEFPRKIQS